MQGLELDGRYQLMSLIGVGAMGEVWEAFDLRMRRPVAVKLVREADEPSEAEWRFTDEIRAAAGLDHAHVVTVHDCGEHRTGGGQRLLFLVMERVDGTDLARVFAEPGPLPWYDVVHWSAQVAQALAAAHGRNIVHRDVKPANVLRTRTGVIKLADFGVAKMLDELARAGRSHPGTVLGTPSYMSPEQAWGEAVDFRSDLYGLGCLLYEGLTGTLPFPGADRQTVLRKHTEEAPPPLAERAPEVPAAVGDLVMRLLAKRPADRPQSAAEVAYLLAAALEAHRPGEAAEALRREARREAADLRARAEGHARALHEEAERYAAAVRAGADGVLDEARREAERILREAHRRARTPRAGARAAAPGRSAVTPSGPGGPAQEPRAAAGTRQAGPTGTPGPAAPVRVPLMLTAAPGRAALPPGPGAARRALTAALPGPLPVLVPPSRVEFRFAAENLDAIAKILSGLSVLPGIDRPAFDPAPWWRGLYGSDAEEGR
ncbi:hypothetical protein GCM10010302_12500 [Streptomyces polychromogenes]|uniref:non-specific serine/threonine protein kinase n=1 Tax=Streptomyces polychromogenes TaxID=67342 RepID=A0ABN0V5U6_9ACTN